VITSVPTLSALSPNSPARPTPRARISTSTGLVGEVTCLLQHTTHKRRWEFILYRQGADCNGLLATTKKRAEHANVIKISQIHITGIELMLMNITCALTSIAYIS
jgi:hypothetical protein